MARGESIQNKFVRFYGNPGRLPTDANHVNYIRLAPEGKILFSVSQLGLGLSCHFTADKTGLRYLKPAIEDFFEYLLEQYPWAEVVFAKASRPSVKRLLEKCNFRPLVSNNEFTAYIRRP